MKTAEEISLSERPQETLLDELRKEYEQGWGVLLADEAVVGPSYDPFEEEVPMNVSYFQLRELRIAAHLDGVKAARARQRAIKAAG